MIYIATLWNLQVQLQANPLWQWEAANYLWTTRGIILSQRGWSTSAPGTWPCCRWIGKQKWFSFAIYFHKLFFSLPSDLCKSLLRLSTKVSVIRGRSCRLRCQLKLASIRNIVVKISVLLSAFFSRAIWRHPLKPPWLAQALNMMISNENLAMHGNSRYQYEWRRE